MIMLMQTDHPFHNHIFSKTKAKESQQLHHKISSKKKHQNQTHSPWRGQRIADCSRPHSCWPKDSDDPSSWCISYRYYKKQTNRREDHSSYKTRRETAKYKWLELKWICKAQQDSSGSFEIEKKMTSSEVINTLLDFFKRNNIFYSSRRHSINQKWQYRHLQWFKRSLF